MWGDKKCSGEFSGGDDPYVFTAFSAFRAQKCALSGYGITFLWRNFFFLNSRRSLVRDVQQQ